jgi:hypothetical protein
MTRFDQSLLRAFLPTAIGRACPSTIVRSGEDACKVDCFVVAIDEGDKTEVDEYPTHPTARNIEFEGRQERHKCCFIKAKLNHTACRLATSGRYV